MTRHRSRVLHVYIIWLAAIALLCSYGYSVASAQPSAALHNQALFVAFISISFGIVVFLEDGGRRLTATGCYFLSVAVFVGGALLLIVRLDTQNLNQAVINVAAFALSSEFITLLIADRLRPEFRPEWKPRWSPDALPRSLMGSVGLISFGVALYATGITQASLPSRIILPGVLLASVTLGLSLVSSPLALRPRSILLVVLVAIGVAVFVKSFYVGFGRLVIADMLLAVVVVLALVAPRRWYKLTIVALIVPALSFSGHLRVSTSEARGATAVSASQGSGLGSVFSPLETFAGLVRADRVPADSAQKLVRQDGRTFVADLTFWVPRFIWPGKPVGFGAQLVPVFQPTLVHTKESLAALSYGEWYADFGFLGVLIAPLFVGAALAGLDRWLFRLLNRKNLTARNAYEVIMFAIAAAGVCDYVWGGTFTYVSREVPALLGAMVVGKIVEGRVTKSDGGGTTPRMFGNEQRTGSAPLDTKRLGRTIYQSP